MTRKRSRAADASRDIRSVQQQTQSGKECDGVCQSEQASDTHQEAGNHEDSQLPALPTELLKIILSYTGVPAAVIAVGCVGMRTWTADNIAEWLHQHHVAIDIGTQQAYPIGALLRAIRSGLNEPARLLLARLGGLKACSFVLSDLLSEAAHHGCVSIVGCILDWLDETALGGDWTNKLSGSMMYAACRSNQVQVAQMLLDETRPHVRLLNDEKNEYVETAVGHGHADVLKELLETSRAYHANANYNDCSALCTAAMFGYVDCVRVLLDTSRPSCASANAQDNMPLMYAAIHGHLDIVKELLDTSRPNHALADARESQTLTYALINGHVDILRELLSQEHHAADARSAMGVRALETTVRCGYHECCHLLLH